MNMNDVIHIGTFVDCDHADDKVININADVAWTHNKLGCEFIQLLQSFCKINISYDIIKTDIANKEHIDELLRNGTIDLYANPVALQPTVLQVAFPIYSVFRWRVGFIVRRQKQAKMLQKFYSKPFSNSVWICLCWILLSASFLFYLMSLWEKHMLSIPGECSLILELFTAFSGLCVHVFQVETFITSRRIAYFTFFLFSYVIYAYYTSNLLSHLVNDKEDDITLEAITTNGYSYVIMMNMKEYYKKFISAYYFPNMFKTTKEIPVVTVSKGLNAVKSYNTALLADYRTVYPEIIKAFTPAEICELFDVDLFVNVKKYLISSKQFRFKEQLKISALRLQESGLLRRLSRIRTTTALKCTVMTEVSANIMQVSGILVILLFCYLMTILILIAEIFYDKRYRLWPYIN